jgi:hypothetical protein
VHILIAAISTGYHSKLRNVKFLAADLKTEHLHTRIAYHLTAKVSATAMLFYIYEKKKKSCSTA